MTQSRQKPDPLSPVTGPSSLLLPPGCYRFLSQLPMTTRATELSQRTVFESMADESAAGPERQRGLFDADAKNVA